MTQVNDLCLAEGSRGTELETCARKIKVFHDSRTIDIGMKAWSLNWTPLSQVERSKCGH